MYSKANIHTTILLALLALFILSLIYQANSYASILEAKDVEVKFTNGQNHLTTKISLINSGFMPLTINEVITSCDCIKPVFDGDVTIKAGQKYDFLLQVDAPKNGTTTTALIFKYGRNDFISAENKQVLRLDVVAHAANMAYAIPADFSLPQDNLNNDQLFTLKKDVYIQEFYKVDLENLAIRERYNFIHYNLSRVNGGINIELRFKPPFPYGVYRLPITLDEKLGGKVLWSGLILGEKTGIVEANPKVVVFKGDSQQESVVVESSTYDESYKVLGINLYGTKQINVREVPSNANTIYLEMHKLHANYNYTEGCALVTLEGRNESDTKCISIPIIAGQ